MRPSPDEAGLALAAVLEDLGHPAAAWITRHGHRGGAAAVAADIASTHADSGMDSLLYVALHAWGAGDDQHAARCVVAWCEADGREVSL